MIPQPLIADIDKFLAAHGMADSTFGRHAVNDWKFVRDLRAGKRRVWPETADKVQSFMSNFAVKPEVAAA